MTIDWSKAPEGATHYTHPLDDSGVWLAVFWREEGGKFTEAWSVLEDGRLKNIKKPTVLSDVRGRMIARPVSWFGYSPPPVGTVCEYRVGQGPWFECEIRYITTPYHDCPVEVVMFPPHLKGEQTGVVGDGEGEISFRPIRTLEQNAADERDKASVELAGILAGHDQHIAVRDIEMAKYLYDIGYRKEAAK
jgi:hypothetical protein